MNNKWLVILNPNAGGGLAKREWPHIEHELKRQELEFKKIETNYPLHAISLIGNMIKSGYRRVIAIGGDGTLHEIVNGIMYQEHIDPGEIILGMISVGTGNDWIKTHSISTNYAEAIRLIKKERIIHQDVGRVVFKNDQQIDETRYFINSVGIGFDARVVKYILPNKLKGKSKKSDYTMGLIKSLFAHKNTSSLIHLDNKKIETKIYNLSIGVCQYKGGGFKLLPNAIPNDGLLDVTLACKISKRKLILSLPKLFGGRVEKIKYFDFYQVQDIKLDISSPICFEADGEYLGLYPLHVSIIPNQLRLISDYR
ncbi:MAG: diacylglycerol kinase family lipid kinase [Prolixibacteraceae bacterium]|nr:diacylglycerol kinase family lipid kinase [Prolixibacteraceae bacterium]MBN2650162.1 diacylglycerol kinase family lipid kinase [Prolixibacteraceae bacterium]